MKTKQNPERLKTVARLNKVEQRKRQDGFSLLEILVAFSILAIALGILLNIFSSGVQTAVVAEEYTAAVQIAESLLARTGVESQLQAGHATGLENEKYRWELTVEPYELTVDNIDNSTIPASLFMVTVNVNWGEDNGRLDSNQRQVAVSVLKVSKKTI